MDEQKLPSQSDEQPMTRSLTTDIAIAVSPTLAVVAGHLLSKKDSQSSDKD